MTGGEILADLVQTGAGELGLGGSLLGRKGKLITQLNPAPCLQHFRSPRPQAHWISLWGGLRDWNF